MMTATINQASAPVTMAEPSPMRAIDRARRHFSSRRVKRIEVAEWADDDGRPLVVMAQPLNLRQQDKLDKLKSKYDSFELMAHVLIKFALDEQGNQLFTLSDKHDLMESVDPEVLAELAYKITRPQDPEEIKKNS